MNDLGKLDQLDALSKTVILATKPAHMSKKVAIEKPRVKRVVTETKKWQTEYPQILAKTWDFSIEGDKKNRDLTMQQIRQKISGYRAQDVEKHLLNEELFVKVQDVLELIERSCEKCYYCKEPVMILYEYVREPKQWTLERLDNSFGHNRNNVVLACLRCNLRRRCMASEKYIKTKEMTTIVKLTENKST